MLVALFGVLTGLPARADFPLRAERALAERAGEVKVTAWVERARARPGRGPLGGVFSVGFIASFD